MGHEYLSVYIVLVVLAGFAIFHGVKPCREHERLAVFRLGRLVDVKGPGLVLLVPVIDVAKRVDLDNIDPHWRHAAEAVLKQKVREHVLLQ